MGADRGTARDSGGHAGQIQRGQLTDAGHGGNDTGCHRHSNGGGADRDTNQRSNDEGDHDQRQTGGGNGIADDITQAGVLQHISQHTAAGRDQQDHTGGFQRFRHDFFQFYA